MLWCYLVVEGFVYLFFYWMEVLVLDEILWLVLFVCCGGVCFIVGEWV